MALDKRTVIVVERSLPIGLAANAAAVVAFTLGARLPGLLGPEVADGSGQRHAGLIPVGLPVLAASTDELTGLRERAAEQEVLLADFPAAGQETTDYEQFGRMVAATVAADLRYLALALHGPARIVRRLTGSISLLR